jgi:hypothetical protein
VDTEIAAAVQAVVENKPSLASRRVQVALMLLARIAVSSRPFDATRSRSAMLSLREAQRELARGLPR